MTNINFTKSKLTLQWDDSYESILELAEANDLHLPFSCRMGNCTSCQHPLLKGSVEYPFGHTGEPDPGYALLCCSKPKGDEDLEINA